MRIIVRLLIFFMFQFAFIGLIAQTSNKGLIAGWSFDRVENNRTLETKSGLQDSIIGHHAVVKGIAGKAIKFDGFTTSIERAADEAPEITEAFTIEAWIAPQAYPWNWCAIYNQEYNHQRGIFFGIDGEGRVGLHAAISRQWRECISEEKIPFMEWSHVTATFDPEAGMKVYINGNLSGELNVSGDLLYDREIKMEIGRNHHLTTPSSLNRGGFVRVKASYSFDGIIDELKIHSGAFSPKEIMKKFSEVEVGNTPELMKRKLPEIPTGKTGFGAFYTRLKYDPDWDRLWKDDYFSDVVITFPEKEYSMVFWKGTNYNMNLVTENGKWLADQSAETFGEFGCMEHMSDKQNRYSHVRIIENSDARVVVHWRYALTDINYTIANIDPRTNWGDWADEYYYVYPDGIAVRHFKIHGLVPQGEDEIEYSITEPTLLSNSGEYPEDNIDMNSVTLANLKGQTSTHSFEKWPADENGAFWDAVENPLLAQVNTKSATKAVYIYEPGSSIGPYGGGPREVDYRLSKFHWRNHWPVNQMPTDGRFALSNDRITSSAILTPNVQLHWNDGAYEGRFILGLSDRSLKELIPFARFWTNTPTLDITSGPFSYEGFSRDDRAYHLIKEGDEGSELVMSFDCSPEAPIVNPVFIIENWGLEKPLIRINDRLVSDQSRYSIRKTLKSNDLILFLQMHEEEITRISITATE